MKTLHLTLKKQWFLMIASGEKKEEYREIKPYWVKRLTQTESKNSDYEAEMLQKGKGANVNFTDSYGLAFMEGYCFPKGYDIVSANNGYAKDCPNIKWKHKGIRIGEGKPEWGAVPGIKYFILEIGEIIK